MEDSIRHLNQYQLRYQKVKTLFEKGDSERNGRRKKEKGSRENTIRNFKTASRKIKIRRRCFEVVRINSSAVF